VKLFWRGPKGHQMTTLKLLASRLPARVLSLQIYSRANVTTTVMKTAIELTNGNVNYPLLSVGIVQATGKFGS